MKIQVTKKGDISVGIFDVEININGNVGLEKNEPETVEFLSKLQEAFDTILEEPVIEVKEY